MRNGSGVRTSLFLPCMLVSVSLFLIYIYRCCQFSLAEAGYYCARAFISGEFAASFGWQIYYYTVKTFRVNHAKRRQRNAYQSSGAVYGFAHYSSSICSRNVYYIVVQLSRHKFNLFIMNRYM